MIYSVIVSVLPHGIYTHSVFVIVHSTNRSLGGGGDTLQTSTLDHHLCSCGRNSTAGNNHCHPLEGESANNREI